MNRDAWLKKLRSIIARVEAGEAPVRIREIYVFGSFARGAMEPNDLDLIVIHDRPSQQVMAPFLAAVKSYSCNELDQEFKAHDRFTAAMRKVFRRGSDRVDVKLGESLEEAILGMVTLSREEIRLIWVNGARDWEANIAAIAVNPAAGRHPRHHFIEMKYTAGTLEDVEKVTKFIDERVLDLQRIRLDDIEPRLNPIFQHWLAYWTYEHSMGTESLKVLPWALWWVQEQGGERPKIWDHNEVGDEERRYLAHVVRIYPYYVYSSFNYFPGLVRQCLIPQRRVREENWIYVFERGSNWEAAEDRPRRER